MCGDFNNLRTAIIAQAMVRQVFDHIKKTSDPPDEEKYDYFLEEAEAIADEVKKAMHRSNNGLSI